MHTCACTVSTEHSKAQKVVDTFVCCILHNMSIRHRLSLAEDSDYRRELELVFQEILKEVNAKIDADIEAACAAAALAVSVLSDSDDIFAAEATIPELAHEDIPHHLTDSQVCSLGNQRREICIEELWTWKHPTTGV